MSISDEGDLLITCFIANCQFLCLFDELAVIVLRLPSQSDVGLLARALGMTHTTSVIVVTCFNAVNGWGLETVVDGDGLDCLG